MSAQLGTRQKQYQQFLKGRQPARPVLKNSLRAFLAGGAICLLGQGIQELFVHYFHMSEKMAGNPTVAVLIMISAIFTGLGFYDMFSQWAGAGSAVPVTGFANAVTSAALEHKTEGYVVGIGSNMFKVAGPVIVFGVVAAFFVGLARYLILHL
ncbi:stage V sporulation protein AC [Sulfoacidibacillus thermotolerans]|uniref:Stage V sporulation protein AC n=1 Tax=Sulfoacidibacillus thermotolerans TaxID=1765684 RepID=A0A2U3D6Q9_SULT2|nr:stage V sporulation protein AC [Sulfoacidibacillus thermotolerans]PWI56970.1 stage V sporulation protein AC [Sulfoacidibacillus thermotolerans]